MIDKLRKQRTVWNDVERGPEHDTVPMDFKGHDRRCGVRRVGFQNMPLVPRSGAMIQGFESACSVQRQGTGAP